MSDRDYDLLSVGAHPDDVEVGSGGVLIDAAKRGYRCGIVILTQGEMSTGGTPQVRAEEVRKAAHILGADILATFDWGDMHLEDTYDHRVALANIIRETRPKVILAPYPHVGHGRRQSHPDHVAAGIITINAASLAALKKADLPGKPHQVKRVFHFFLPPGLSPNLVVDITPHYEQWVQALSAHESQFLNPEKGKDYIESITAMSRSFGLQARCKYGQGFYAVEPILVTDIMTLAESREGEALRKRDTPHSE
ncbi:MAG: PIG-L family deacetylase [Candidatus Zixiibacteriota bacterium]